MPSHMVADERLFPRASWWPELPQLAERYRGAEPFPHIHLSDFLDEEVVRAVAAEFPGPGVAGWTAFRHYNENKWAITVAVRQCRSERRGGRLEIQSSHPAGSTRPTKA